MPTMYDEDGIDGPFEREMSRVRASTLDIRDPKRPDNLDYRKELLAKVKRGEITFEAAQAEVRRLKRTMVKL